MLAFGLSNIRALRDIAPISIKPITLLVGRNSSGKSSFLRCLPLLRQSIVTRTSAPILWFGDLVDFGDFKTVVTDNKIAEQISFRFLVDTLNVSVRPQYSFDAQAGYEASEPRQFSVKDIDIRFNIAGEGTSTRLSSIRLANASDNLISHFEFQERTRQLTSFKMNGVEYSHLFGEYALELANASLFSHIYATLNDQQNKLSRRVPLERIADRILRTELAKWMQPLVHGRTQERTLQRWSSVLLRLPSIGVPDLSALRQRSGNASFSALISKIASDPDNEIYDRFKELYNVGRAVAVLDATLNHLMQTISDVQYMGPVRTRNERYYRYQDLAVSEIDPDARNFPMFLNSLTTTQIDRFSNWVKDIFGFGVKVSRREGHISIQVVQSGKDVNVVDTGYGVSQILPILGQIWWAKFGRLRGVAVGRTFILTIEQPELHLHPAHQALLADALIAALKHSPGEPGIKFVIETHSEAMINRLGEFISLDKLAPEAVSVNLFHANLSNSDKTSASESKFGLDGQLLDWPFGFFQPEPAE